MILDYYIINYTGILKYSLKDILQILVSIYFGELISTLVIYIFSQ